MAYQGNLEKKYVIVVGLQLASVNCGIGKHPGTHDGIVPPVIMYISVVAFLPYLTQTLISGLCF
jgi:hypothetical protein